MTTPNPLQRLEKLTRIWSDAREKQIVVRIQYSVEQNDSGKIYHLAKVEELD